MTRTRYKAIIQLLLFAAILLMPAIAAASPVDGGMTQLADVGNKFLSAVENTFTSIATVLAGTTFFSILAACVALRILAIVIPALADSNGSSFGPEAVKLIVTVGILTTMAHEWAGGDFNIYQHIWSGTDDLLQKVVGASIGSKPSIPSSGNPLPSIGSWLISSCIHNIVSSYDGMVAFLSPPGGLSFWKWAEAFFTANNGAAILVILVMLITALLVAYVYGLIILDFIMSWAHVAVAMTFGPLVLAFYPIKPDWGKTVLTEVASGIMTFLATAAIVVVANNFINVATDALNTIGVQYTAGSLANSSTGGIVIALGAYAFIIFLIGKSVSVVNKVAAALVGGRDHFSPMRGTGAALAAGMVGGMSAAGVKMANSGSKGAGGAVAKGAGTAAGAAAGAVAGAMNLATGHTAGKLASLRAQRSQRAAATAASNAARNAGTPNVGSGNGSSSNWTLKP
ncbi:hypothetical protein AB7849_15355 [Rhodanobacter sp. 115]|uniref:hypothetical protein n=1 Tax=Rhodanobacter sp. FW021-MT20 TaxID=1162282 RepID=UPI0034E43A36